MRTVALAACLAAGLVASSGCEPTDLIRQGDRCMRTGHPDLALEHYRHALVEEPKLAEKKNFVAKLKKAESRAAYREGEKLASAGQWEAAVGKFAESRKLEPDFENAREAYAKAARQAARVRHERALKLADEGKGAEAVAELKRAVELDGNNADAAAALALATGGGKAYPGAAADLYGRGIELQRQKHWKQAAGFLREAIRLEPNHVLGRVALYRGGESMRSAEQARADGEDLLKARRLDEAIATLQRALYVWPGCPGAPEVLAATRTRRAKAEGLYDRARQRAGESDVVGAAAAAAAALDVFPAHKGAREVFEKVRGPAAAAREKAGKAALERGDLAGATPALRDAVRYAPKSRSARALLAEVCRRHGGQAENAGYWGNALLWYMEAIDNEASPEAVNGMARATKKIAERVAFPLAVEVTGPPAEAKATEALGSELVSALMAEGPDFVGIVPASRSKRAAYTALVKLEKIATAEKLARTERKRHDFTIRREVPNPEIPRLAELLRAKHLELSLLKRDFERRCPRCRGRGRRICPTCRGRGTVRCDNCGGKGTLRCRQCGGTGTKNGAPCPRCHGTGTARCLRCGGDGRMLCPTCSQLGQRRGWLVCSTCGGTGRATTVSRMAIRSRERDVADLEARLAKAPAKVTRKIPAQWAYTVRHYEKTGAISTNLHLASPAGTMRQEKVNRQFAAKDTAIEGANPAIGLAEDSLDLPDDAAVRTSLIQAVAGEIARRAVGAVIADRIEATRRRAERLAGEGKALEAAEARMDLVQLLKPIRSKEASGLLTQVRTAHVRPSFMAADK